MRLQVQINDNVVQRIDAIANRYGMTRAALVQYMLGAQLDSIELSNELIRDMMKDGVKDITKRDS